jgi:4-carboxymuconolactone decarboxylase
VSNYPNDIYPETHNRLPLVKREELDEQGQRAYDEFVTGSATSLAGLQGPGGMMLHNPRLSMPQRAYNRALRTDPELGPALTELAILVSAREMSQPFEWTVHEPEARKAGLDPRAIDIVKHRRPIEGIAAKEAIIIRLGREVYQQRKVSSETYAEAERLFGRRGLVTVTAIMGAYAATAVLLTVFDQQFAPEVESLLPMP